MSYPTRAVHVLPACFTEQTPGSRDAQILLHYVSKEVTSLTCLLLNWKVHSHIHNSPTALFWARWIQFTTFFLVSFRYISILCRSHWPRGLRPRSAAARLLRLWVRTSPGAWMSVCCERCVLSGRGLCDELITRPEESYRMWCVVVCDPEISWMRRPWPTEGRRAKNK